jgi:putative membrane protein insertion efficiency factor
VKYPADSLLKSKNIHFIKKLGIAPISIWQRISYNTIVFDCQFYPSCSNYGSEAIKDFGFLKGGFVVADRIARCNPFAYYYHLELNRPFYEKDGRMIDTVHQKKVKKTSKSPLFAALLSSVFPGLGRIYSGRVIDGVFGMTNFFFVGSHAFKSLKNQNASISTILSVVSFYLYGSEIYGAYRQAKYYQPEENLMSR